MLERSFNRAADEKRPVRFTTAFTKNAYGSVLVEFGDTKVIVTASVEDRVPKFLSDTGSGWVTAEYSMLPGSTLTRTQRERNYPSGRTQEIQRLIGRSLRAAIDLESLGERTITIDCDVIQADGGTRTASISGAYVALYEAVKKLCDQGVLSRNPMKPPVAAISVGILKGKELLDLDYPEDSSADVDANVVMTESGELVEFQCSAEGDTFSKIAMIRLLELAHKGINEVISLQKEALKI